MAIPVLAVSIAPDHDPEWLPEVEATKHGHQGKSRSKNTLNPFGFLVEFYNMLCANDNLAAGWCDDGITCGCAARPSGPSA